MRSNINLIERREVADTKVKKILLTSVAFFAVVFLFAGSIIFYTFYLKNSLANLKTKELTIAEDIRHEGGKNNKKVKFLVIRERLSTIEKIKKMRKNINAKLEEIFDILASDIRVESIDATNEKIAIKVSSQNLSEIHSLLEEKLKQYPGKQVEIKRIDLSSFELDPHSHIYSLAIDFDFAKK